MSNMAWMEDPAAEYKREYADDLAKTVVAFANTNGGTIYVGIDNDGHVTGLADINGTLEKVTHSIRDSIKPDITLLVECQTQRIEGKPVLKIIVQKGAACPYYIASKGMCPEGVSVRQGASTLPATEAAILQMIRDTDGDLYEDRRSLHQALTFGDAEQRFAARGIPFDVALQKALHLMNADGIYTNLGLLFSDQCTHTVKLAIFEGTTKMVFKDRREFSGSILKQVYDVFDFIDHHNGNRAEFEGLARIDSRDYPIEAVREALLNAIVHRDYAFGDSVLMSMFDDRMEFVSIGGLVKGISCADIMLGISVARNKHLANIMYRLALIEAYGTGIPKIMRSYQGMVMQPKLETTGNVFKVTLPNSHAERGSGPWSEQEKAVLTALRQQQAFSRRDVEKTLRFSQSMAVKVLKGLVEKGILRVTGSGKRTVYTWE